MAEDTSVMESKTGLQPSSPRRGHPQRLRKPNPRVFGDYEDYTITRPTSRSKKPFVVKKMHYAYKSPERMAAMPNSYIQQQQQQQVQAAQAAQAAQTMAEMPMYASTSKSRPNPFQKGILSTPDKKTAQNIGVHLRNLLKLPKAHKWVVFEWFYSNIDQVLFQGENDFSICVRESFPQLKTRKLTRVEWGKMRRLIGKPRRCSPAFFAEERAALQRKREKIRLLQQRKASEITDWKDLPDEIPMPLVIGTKVTARLRKPQDGLFTGQIDALDTVNHTYRITFDRTQIGTHSVPDIEVLSDEPQDTVPLGALQPKRPARLPVYQFLSPQRQGGRMASPSDHHHLANDPLLGSSPLRTSMNLSSLELEDGMFGTFPVKFLVLVTRLTKILGLKKAKVKALSDMNTEAEKLGCHGQGFSAHYQQQYAALVLELETINRDLNEHWIGVQQYAQEIAPDQGISALDQPSEIMKKCTEQARNMLKKHNVTETGEPMVQRSKNVDLIAKLTGLLLQIHTFTEHEMHSFEFKSLQDSLEDIKQGLDPSSLEAFRGFVEVHINHIQTGLSQMGNLHAFATHL